MPGKFQTFKNPVFFSGTPKSAEIVQGAVEDCYLVSALSTMTSIERLINNLCVAVSPPLLDGFFCVALTALLQRDEEVGIYGFLFYRDCYWVPVIVDE